MQWIKVQDRLPDENSFVLCIDKYDRMFVAEYYKYPVYYDPGYIDRWNSGFCCGREPDDPTHWMPLPKIPEKCNAVE